MKPIGIRLLKPLVRIAAGCVVAALATWGFAAAPDRGPEGSDWAEARSLRLRGRYEEAIEQFRPAAEHVAGAAIGLARCYRETGKTSAAADLLRRAAEQHPKSADVAAEQALLALETGDYDEAAKQADRALALDNESLPARWVQAETFRLAGQLDKAEAAYGSLIDQQRRWTAQRKTIDAESLYWIGRAAAEHARWTRNHRMFHSLVNDLYPAALKEEAEFWPAKWQIALLFQEKFNAADSADALAAALAINPTSADLHVARAQGAVRSFNLDLAQSSLERALEINPRHVGAMQLRADLKLIAAEPAEALTLLEEARTVQPRDEATLGRLLACQAALDGATAEKPSDRMQTLIDEVAHRNPHCGEFFLAAGDAADAMRRFGQAVGFYREALRRMPQLLATRSHLGMTLMRLGEESEAARVLEEAFAADPFHVRVKNTLEVLDLLQSYAVLETDHFVLKFDRGHDELLARYAAKYLEEEIYPRLTQTLGYVPKDKTLFEIFSRGKNTSGHGWFSARMAGVPAVGTVGACAGKMVAITSPAELPKKFNWATVLRHEFVHVLNLQQTDFNVPHWLTEGIAVHLEDLPRPEEWNALLVRRAREKTLFTLDNILLGFVRPRQRDDWTLAYCQAELYIDYARQTHGDDAIARLLAAYADCLSTPQAIERALGVTQAEFETGYAEFIAKLVDELAGEETAEKTSLATLINRAEANPDDPAAAAALAERYLAQDDKPRAHRWAEAALKSDPNNSSANYVLARLQLSIGGTDEATARLEKGASAEPPHEASLALLAALRLKAEDLEAAEKWYARGREAFPRSDRWDKGLARIYLTRGDNEKLAPILVRLAAHDQNSLPIRKKLAELAVAREDWPEAGRWAREALHLDVSDAQTHALLAAAAAGAKQFATAAEEYAVAVELDGEQPELRLAWGRALLGDGKKEQARRVLRELQDKAPDLPGLSQLLEESQP